MYINRDRLPVTLCRHVQTGDVITTMSNTGFLGDEDGDMFAVACLLNSKLVTNEKYCQSKQKVCIYNI